MSLESRMFKKERSERISMEEMERRRIQGYLMSKFGMEQSISSKVADLLERSQLNYKKLSSGFYDSIVSTALEEIKANEQQEIQQQNNTEMDLERIRETEVKENVTPTTYNYQNQPQSSQAQQQQINDARQESKEQLQQLLDRMNTQREETRSRHFR